MQEINLYDLLKYYARNWLILLSAVFVGAIIGLAYTFFIQTPLYKSEATVLIVGERTTQDSAIINNNYLELFKSRRVLEPVIEKQTYDGDYNQLLKLSTATNAKETDVIRVSIADTNAEKVSSFYLHHWVHSKKRRALFTAQTTSRLLTQQVCPKPPITSVSHYS